jgi:hypothetical protein
VISSPDPPESPSPRAASPPDEPGAAPAPARTDTERPNPSFTTTTQSTARLSTPMLYALALALFALSAVLWLALDRG